MEIDEKRLREIHAELKQYVPDSPLWRAIHDVIMNVAIEHHQMATSRYAPDSERAWETGNEAACDEIMEDLEAIRSGTCFEQKE
jgi:hypothetical protein